MLVVDSLTGAFLEGNEFDVLAYTYTESVSVVVNPAPFVTNSALFTSRRPRLRVVGTSANSLTVTAGITDPDMAEVGTEEAQSAPTRLRIVGDNGVGSALATTRAGDARDRHGEGNGRRRGRRRFRST